MQITTDLQKLKPTFNHPEGGYEWWYFDGISQDGEYSIVVILYLNNPFSTNYIKEIDNSGIKAKKHPAVSISIYKQHKTIYYSFLEFEEDQFLWYEEELSLTIEKHKLVYTIIEDEIEFSLEIDQQLDSGHALKGTLKGKATAPGMDNISNKVESGHVWNLLMPFVNMDVQLLMSDGDKQERVQQQFQGYHDHNFGAEPMKDSFRDWYWGRYHFRDFTLIYYLMNKHQEQQFEAWLVDRKSQKVLCSFEDIQLQYEQITMFGLKSARKIILLQNETEATIQLRNLADNGPFYQRFIGEGIVKYKGQVHAAQGISEYIYPKNIYKKLYWPLVHMRLRYMNQNPHWVQKSNFLYPKTW